MQTHQTSGDGNEECCSETDAKTMKKNSSKTFQKNLTTISKIRYRQKKTTKRDINSGNTHSDIASINNLQKLLLNLTSEISCLQKYVTDELYGLNKTVDRIRTDQSNKPLK